MQGSFECDDPTVALPPQFDFRSSDYVPLEGGGQEFRAVLTDDRYVDALGKLSDNLSTRNKMLNHRDSGLQACGLFSSPHHPAREPPSACRFSASRRARP